MHIPSQFVGRYVLLVALVLVPWAATTARAQQANPILTDLLQKGVSFDQLGLRPLRPPTVDDGLTADQQQAALAPILKLKQGQTLTYERFTGTGLNAPYVLVMDDPKYGSNAPGHSIDLWFTVYGKLAKVAEPGFLKKQFQPDPKDEMIVLKAVDLQPRGIKLQVIPGGQESYAYGQFRIFPTDTRVLVGGTCRLAQTTSATSTVLAGIMDPRFDNDTTMPNQWRPVLGTAGGQLQLGNPTIYHSAGGYTKITELVEPAGALLVEYHFVFDEPQAWFNGNNLLRPKLVQETPDDVRMFRRKLLLSK